MANAGSEDMFMWLLNGARAGVMVNFMCQVDWTTGYSDIWPNITLGVLLRMFLDKINI